MLRFLLLIRHPGVEPAVHIKIVPRIMGAVGSTWLMHWFAPTKCGLRLIWRKRLP